MEMVVESGHLESFMKKRASPRRQPRTHATPRAAHPRVTVVIPVLNESKTIAQVIRLARRSKLVSEVLVIDDGSHDGTPEIATRAGARVLTSAMLGKGVSMEEGMRAARNEIVLYLDGDLRGLTADLVEKMAGPLLTDAADFVKARFARAAGRVTVLTAKPLLRTYFPELAGLEQPLGGIMASRKALLSTLRFESDYGVDVGLVIDAAAQGARILEIDIGRLEHDSQSLESLGEMATQVARTILERAAEWGRLQVDFLHRTREHDRRRRATDVGRVADVVRKKGRLALLDMDGTIVEGRMAVAMAQRTGRLKELTELIDRADLDPKRRTERIARLFEGVPKRTFEEVAKDLPLSPGAVELIVGLRRLGYVIGVCTDSWHVAATIVRRRIFADFAIANVLHFRGDQATGEVTIAPAMQHQSGCRRHAICKRNVLVHMRERLGIAPREVLAVGDSDNDVCLLRAVGKSVAFRPKSPAVAAAADRVVQDSLASILSVA